MKQRLTFSPASMGILLACLVFFAYNVGSMVVFSYRDRGQPLSSLLEKQGISAFGPLGALPKKLQLTQYNGKFEGKAETIDFNQMIESAKQGTVLVLWYARCPSCMKHLSTMAKLSVKYPKINFVVVTTEALGAPLDEIQAKWKKAITKPHRLRVLSDSENLALFRTFFRRMQKEAVPITAFVDNKGEIRETIVGQVRWDRLGSSIFRSVFA